MKITITKSDFISTFHNMGRGDQFTYNGLCELYDFLIDMENDTGEEFELDVIALCCDFSEESIDEVIDNYEIDFLTEGLIDYDEVINQVVEFLEEHTSVVYVDWEKGTVLYQEF